MKKFEIKEEDVIDIVAQDPRWRLDTLQIQQREYGMAINLEITYIPYNIGESLQLAFNDQQGLEISSNSVTSGASTNVPTASNTGY